MTETAAIRILIVDDHEGVRLGLTTALATADDLLVVGAAASGSDALRLCGLLSPDVVLMEIDLPDQDGLDLIELLRGEFSRLRIVVLTTSPGRRLKERATAAGASGCLPKYVAVAELIAVIREAHTRGGSVGAPRRGD